MSESTQTQEMLSREMPEKASNKNIIALLTALLAFLCQKYEEISMVIRHGVVIFGTSFYDRVAVPAALLGLGLFTAGRRIWTYAKHYMMIAGHEISVKIARIKANRLTAVMIMTSLLILVMSTTLYSVGLEITLDGKSIGYVMEESDFENGMALVEKRVSEVLGRPYAMNPVVTYSIGIVQRDKVLNENALKNVLYSGISEVSELYVLTVDDEVVGASASESSLKNMMNEILNPSSDPNVRTEFNREVKIEKTLVDTSYIRSYDEMRAILTSNVQDEMYYEIQPGDTMLKIAKKHGTTKATILSYNPGLDPGKLMAGEKIVVSPAIPFLSVTQTRRVEYVEKIPYDTIEVKDSSIYKGKTKVKSKGIKGEKKIVADVVYKDNKEVSREILSSEQLKQPVSEVVLVGTKPLPAKMATGKMRRPVNGAYISSNYGYRRRWREFHTGVDFALAYGSKVLAADGGTVSYAGWKGDYGYLVIINHGNGLQTYYGHNSKLLVRAGQKVAKGDQIAKIGSTGRSTGPHCHFEVRVNGKHVSPWRYIS